MIIFGYNIERINILSNKEKQFLKKLRKLISFTELTLKENNILELSLYDRFGKEKYTHTINLWYDKYYREYGLPQIKSLEIGKLYQANELGL